MTVEIPVVTEIKPDLINQLNNFSPEEWMLYISDWPISVLVLLNLSLENEEQRNFWIAAIAKMQFDIEHKIQIQILLHLDYTVFDNLLDAIDIRISEIRSIISNDDLSTLAEV